MSKKLWVSASGSSYDLGPVKEAVDWAFDLMQGMDVMNAAKNCVGMRESPLTTQLEQAVSLLEEIEAAQMVTFS